jgi:hypothetical protein
MIVSIPDNINHQELERKLFLKKTYGEVSDPKLKGFFARERLRKKIPAVCYSLNILGLCDPPGHGLSLPGASCQTFLEQSPYGAKVSRIRFCCRTGFDNHDTGHY